MRKGKNLLPEAEIKYESASGLEFLQSRRSVEASFNHEKRLPYSSNHYRLLYSSDVVNSLAESKCPADDSFNTLVTTSYGFQSL